MTSIKVFRIDPELYERAKELSKELEEDLSELLKLTKDIVECCVKEIAKKGKELAKRVEEIKEEAEAEKGITVISDIEELEVSKEDLEAVEKAIFRGIERLKFKPDVSPELFEEKVERIERCDEVIIPPRIPRLKVASKAKLVKKIVTSE